MASSALIAVLVLLGACSTSSGDPVGTASGGSSAGSPAAASAVGTPSAGAPSSAPGASRPAPATPTDAALQLAAQMGQHSTLASDMMRARIRGDADLAQAADAALVHNTEAMSATLAPFVSAQAREQFDHMWEEHILSLFEYARGHAAKDHGVRHHAREESVEYEGELAQYFADQSPGGRLDRANAEKSIHTHAEHLLANADAYAAGDYAAAARGYRESYSQSYGLGATVARSLLPAAAVTALDSPAVRLRSELGRLLGEHSALVMAMTRSAAGTSQDFAAVGEALNANTTELTGAVDALFGAPTAQRFQALWADQIDQLAAYNTAAVGGATAGTERARTALTRFQTAIGQLLSTATEDRLTAEAAAQALREHDSRLLEEIDAYTGGDFPRAHAASEQIHDAVLVLSAQLAEGIGAAVAARLPSGGSDTGGGGTMRPAGGS